MHRQNPLRKRKGRAQLQLWVLGVKNPADQVTDGIMSSRLAVKCIGFPVVCGSKAPGRSCGPECSALRMKAICVLRPLGLQALAET